MPQGYRGLLGVVMLGLTCLTPSGAASEESAWQAVEAADPELPMAAARALVARLVKLADGARLVLPVGSRLAEFEAQSATVVFTGLVPQAGRSGLRLQLPRPVDLPAVVKLLSSQNRRITRLGRDALTLPEPSTGDELTLGSRGSIVVVSREVLRGMAQVERLEAAVREAIGWARALDPELVDEQVGAAWAARCYDTEPGERQVRWVTWFAGQEDGRACGPMTLTAQLPNVTVVNARLSLAATDRTCNVPRWSIDGRCVSPWYDVTDYAVDITENLRAGSHVITSSVPFLPTSCWVELLLTVDGGPELDQTAWLEYWDRRVRFAVSTTMVGTRAHPVEEGPAQ